VVACSIPATERNPPVGLVRQTDFRGKISLKRVEQAEPVVRTTDDPLPSFFDIMEPVEAPQLSKACRVFDRF